MITNIKQESLRKALEAAALGELPKVFVENGYDFWIDAVALVRKCNGTQSYCLVSHKPDGRIVYEQDFGLMSPIFGLISVHPYKMLDLNNCVLCEPSVVKERRLRNTYGDAVLTMSEEEKKAKLIEIALADQQARNDHYDEYGTRFGEIDKDSREKKANEAPTEHIVDADGFETISSSVTSAKQVDEQKKINDGIETFEDIASVKDNVTKKQMTTGVKKKIGRPKKK